MSGSAELRECIGRIYAWTLRNGSWIQKIRLGESHLGNDFWIGIVETSEDFGRKERHRLTPVTGLLGLGVPTRWLGCESD